MPKKHKTFAMKWIQKKQKVLVGSKSMRCEAQIARFWLLRRRVSQSLRAHSQTLSTGVENDVHVLITRETMRNKDAQCNTRE